MFLTLRRWLYFAIEKRQLKKAVKFSCADFKYVLSLAHHLRHSEATLSVSAKCGTTVKKAEIWTRCFFPAERHARLEALCDKFAAKRFVSRAHKRLLINAVYKEEVLSLGKTQAELFDAAIVELEKETK